MLVRGIAAARAGDRGEARRYLERATYLDGTRDQVARAYLWLSRIAEDPEEKRELLEWVLGYEPTNAEALRALAILDKRLDPEDIIDPDALDRSNDEQPQAAPEASASPVTARR